MPYLVLVIFVVYGIAAGTEKVVNGVKKVGHVIARPFHHKKK